MAIAFDAASQGEITASTTLTISHTVTAVGSDVVILPACEVWSSVGVSAATCTYDSTSCTNEGDVTYGASTSQRIRLFYLADPSTGANDVVFTIDAAQEIVGANTSWTGVDQTTPLDTAVTEVVASGTSISDSVTSAVGDVVIDVASIYNTTNWGADGSQTERAVNDNGSTQDSLGQSSKAGAAGSVTMQWDNDVARPMGLIVVNMNAAGGASNKVPKRMRSIVPSQVSLRHRHNQVFAG